MQLGPVILVIFIVCFVSRGVRSCNRNGNYVLDQPVTVTTEIAATTVPIPGRDVIQQCHNLTSPMISSRCLNHLNDHTLVFISLDVNDTEKLLDAFNRSDCRNQAIDFACHFIYPSCSIDEKCVVKSRIMNNLCLQFPCENYCSDLLER